MSPPSSSPARGRPLLRLIVGQGRNLGALDRRTEVPAGAFVSVAARAADEDQTSRMPRRHVLMLLLAIQMLVLGWSNADRYRPPGVTVDQTFHEGHVIT